MTRDNFVSIDDTDEIYRCDDCGRSFNSYNSLVNHCKNAAVHHCGDDWCQRCDWLFISPSAREAHIRNSSRHNVCEKCGLDCTTAYFLEQHEFHAHDKCLKCNAYFDDVQGHDIEVHNKCAECDKFFDGKNELQQHKRSHLPANIECLGTGCKRKFSEFAAMIIHLESGTCESGVDLEKLNDIIAASYITSIAFVNNATDHYRFSTNYDECRNQYYKYRCPSCGNTFRFLSGLCQHIATDAWNQDAKLSFEQVHRCVYWYLRSSARL